MFKIFGRSDLPLNEEELLELRLRQRRWLIIAAAAVLLLVVGFFAARPTINLVRRWQARRHAQKAFALIDREQWVEARKEATAGYQLRPNEPQAIRAVARLLSRAGQADALNFWKQLADVAPLTRVDLRDEATVAVRAREFGVAHDTIQRLLGQEEGGPAPADWLLAAELAIQNQEFDAALGDVRRVFAAGNASERDQFQATVALDRILLAREAPDRSEVTSRLRSLANSTSATGLDALVALSQQILSAKSAWGETNGVSAGKVIAELEAHPLAKPQHKLLAIDLRIHEGGDKEALMQKAVDEFKNGDTNDLTALAAWLNTHGEYQRELDTIPQQRAMQNRDLFFQHVDAMGALNQWDQIRRLIENEEFPLDPVIAHMYLARCFAQQGQNGGAENNWARSLEAAAGDASKLLILADYAEKNGALDVARRAYEAAVSVAPRSRIAQQGRLRIAYAQLDTTRIHAILEELLKLWPNDIAIQNDEAYARLLLIPNDSENDRSQELAEIQRLAEKLVAHNPTSLPHRTVLALALLRQNRPQEALAVYQDINVPKNALTTSSIAVHAAVLAANGRTDDAKAEFGHLPVDKILPEEKALAPK